MMSFCFPRNLSDKEFNDKIKKLNNCHLEGYSKELSKYDKDLQLITDILFKSSQSQLESQSYFNLIPCAIRILIVYSYSPTKLNIQISEKRFNNSFKYNKAKKSFRKLVKVLMGENKSSDVIKFIIDTISNEKLWLAKDVCVDTITCLFETGYQGSLIFHEICNKLEFFEESEKDDIKYILKVLYKLLDSYKWPETQETIHFIERLLNFYYKSLHDSDTLKDIFFTQLRGSLELCVRHIIQNLTNNYLLILIRHMCSWSTDTISENIILNYGSTLEYAAYMHKEDSFSNTLTSEILTLLMEMIKSKVRFVSLLGNRILQHLIDRGKNQNIFNTPYIFFKPVQLNVKENKYKDEDIKFFKLNREIIHDSFIKSIVYHRTTRINLETTYCSMCLLAIEIPCGYTAAALSCLVMNLQDIALTEKEKFGKEPCCHIHAIVISVLTLICWLYDAPYFQTYINRIVMERAQWAPHLNPPLQPTYYFAVHHVLYDKPELFPLDWEVRYGLWKRFRLDESSKHFGPIFITGY